MSISDLKNLKYIEIDSTYRNRDTYPNPCNFEIPIAQSGYRTKIDSNDPISNMYPIIQFNSSFMKSSNSSNISSPFFFSNFPPIFIQNEDPHLVHIIAVLSPNELRQEKNFYVGSSLGAIPSGTIAYEYRRIISYEYIGIIEDPVGIFNDVGKFKVSEPFLNNSLSSPVITNPSFNNITVPYSYIFIPNGKNIDNFYNNYLIRDETINETLNIISYNSQSKIATLSGNFSNTWNSYDDYTVRKRIPYEFGNVTGISKFILNAPFLSSNIQDYYVGDFIRISQLNSSLYDKTSIITSYDPITKNISIKSPLDNNNIIPNLSAELLNFTNDNMVPLFNYISGESSNQNIYEMELINLVIPNLLITSGKGGYPKDYQYIYLEIYNLSTYGNTRNVLISNNPYSFMTIFRVPIDDTSYYSTSRFLKLNGNGMKQLIKFRPDQSIKILLKLPSGEIISFSGEENFSPKIPNLDLQISLCLSIRLIK